MPLKATHEQPKSAKFVSKLYSIVTNPKLKNTITFGPDDSGIAIINKDKFITNVLSKRFKASKYVWFTRQLTGYGFQRIADHGLSDVTWYRHPWFLKGQPEHLHWIKKISKDDSGDSQNQSEVVESSYNENQGKVNQSIKMHEETANKAA